MRNINSYECFLLEKRIAQISSKIEVAFNYDIIKTSHAADRSNFSKRGLSGDNQNHISNSEIKEFVYFFIKDISHGIATGEIVDQTNFVIKSQDRELSMAIVAEMVSNTYWKLIVKTLFRESEENGLSVYKNQLVYRK